MASVPSRRVSGLVRPAQEHLMKGKDRRKRVQKALDLGEENKKKQHFAAVLGEPVDRRFFTVGRLAVYVHSEKATMSDTLRVNIVK